MAGPKMFTDGGPKDRARRLAASLSLEDQVALLAGKDFWRTVAFPDKGIPSIKVTDGPNGARGEFFTDGTPAALFPCGVSLAATWDCQLIHEVGQHLAAETKARGAEVLLAPTVCLHRSPLGGRNFESFSEDPLLTGKLAASYIAGLQSKGVGATIKHFVGNEEETHRMSMNCNIDERPLRELYLKPFEIAIRDANPWALMTAYNLVNGAHADMNLHTVRDILHGEWKYDGMVMSDWTGTNSVSQSIAAGCDLEMPGPTEWRGQRALKAIKGGELSAKDVERSAANVLYLVERTKGIDGPEEMLEQTEDIPERRELIRKAGHAGLTLLKNEDILPLRNQGETIALIGPNSARAVAHGGGSASLRPYYTTSPLEGIQAAAKGPVLNAVGCDVRKWTPLISEGACFATNGEPGVTVEYYLGEQFEGKAVQTSHRSKSDLFLWDSAPKEVLPVYSFKAKCTLTPTTTGNHTFGFMSVGPGRLYVKGNLLIDNWNWTEAGETMFGGSVEVLQKVQLAADEPVEIVVESTNEIRPRSKVTSDGPKHWYGGCRIGFEAEQTVDFIQEAASIARQADVAIVCVGLDAEWESEGYDRKTMDLPRNGSQDALIHAVAAANPRTVVVNQSGTPVTMPWVNEVPAILQAWYQGQEAGNALADVLFGKANPSGKLPVTFPKALRDNPAYHNWPGENMQVNYGEGIFIGYRHYDRVDLAPLFPFGHGLSYTRFEYGAARSSSAVLSAENGRLVVTVPVRNIGDVTGSETVQLYVHDVQASVQRPDKELQAFAKVHLAPREQRDVELVLDKHAVGFYDTAAARWTAEEGEFEVLIGASSRDIRARCTFRVENTFTWIF